MSGATSPTAPPRLGFLGTGWIGTERLRTLAATGRVRVVAVSDPDPAAAEAARAHAPEAVRVPDLTALLALELDGVVIATPSALHAEQALTALDRGVAVFCQKPLARDGAETARVLAAAERCGRPLGVDLSYRHTAAARRMRELLDGGALADLHAVDLTFHNAYGPDKPWFIDRRLAGGGAVIDLATHLLDLALWLTGERNVSADAVSLRRQGRPLAPGSHEVEDFAWAQLSTAGGVSLRLACSWFLPAGCDAEIACSLFGTSEALVLQNVDGSFYDFRLDHHRGTRRTTVVAHDRDWGGRALEEWAARLGAGEGFDPAEARAHQALANALDAIYATGFAP